MQFAARKRAIALCIQRGKAAVGRLSEFLARLRAIEIEIGVDDWLRHGEKAEPPCARPGWMGGSVVVVPLLSAVASEPSA